MRTTSRGLERKTRGGRAPRLQGHRSGRYRPSVPGLGGWDGSGPWGGQAGHSPRAHKHASARSPDLERGWVCVWWDSWPFPDPVTTQA